MPAARPVRGSGTMNERACEMPAFVAVRQTSIAGALELAPVLAGFGATPAVAEVCQFSDGTRGNGNITHGKWERPCRNLNW